MPAGFGSQSARSGGDRSPPTPPRCARNPSRSGTDPRPGAGRRGAIDPVAGAGAADRARAGRAERREPRWTPPLPLAGEFLALPAEGPDKNDKTPRREWGPPVGKGPTKP